MLAFLCEARLEIGLLLPEAEHTGMRQSGGLLAHCHQFLEAWRRVGILVVRGFRQQHEIALGRYALMIAILREVAVPQRVHSRRDRIATAVRALAGEPDGAE